MKLRNTTAAVALTVMGGMASAATLDITSISGTWVSVNPGKTVGITGVGTSNVIEWGTPGSSGDGVSKSGYEFNAASTPITEAPGATFALGDFVHNNFPIASDPDPSSIDSARLSVDIGIQIGSFTDTITAIFDFTHDETPNGANPCKYGTSQGGVNANGCADRVTAKENFNLSEDFEVGGTTYFFRIAGFEYGAGLFDSFLTAEGAANTAQLTAFYNTVDAPPPPVIPLPAAGWLLLAGVGGLAATGRRKRA